MIYLNGLDEGKTVRERTHVLRPGGWLVLNGPTFDGLRDSPYLAVCGVGRYEACKVRQLPECHTLCSQMTHYWNAWLFLPPLP